MNRSHSSMDPWSTLLRYLKSNSGKLGILHHPRLSLLFISPSLYICTPVYVYTLFFLLRISLHTRTNTNMNSNANTTHTHTYLYTHRYLYIYIYKGTICFYTFIYLFVYMHIQTPASAPLRTCDPSAQGADPKALSGCSAPATAKSWVQTKDDWASIKLPYVRYHSIFYYISVV